VANEIIKVIRPHTYKRLIENFDFKRNLSCVERFLIFNPEDLSLKIEANKHEVIESCIDNLEFIKSILSPGKEYLRNFKNFKTTPIYDLFNRNRGEIKFEIIQKSNMVQKWRFIFIPSLQKKEVAAYKVKWSYGNAKFLSLEEFRSAKTIGIIPKNEEF